jgi:subtilase family serine protease
VSSRMRLRSACVVLATLGGLVWTASAAVGVPESAFTAAAVGAPPQILIGPAAFAAQAKRADSLCPPPHVCYSPALLQQAYDFPTGPKAPTGAGQTIVVVVAYGSPTIEADLANFDAAFDIPPPPSFTIVNGTGAGGVGSGDLVTWGVETSAGVEYAHAMAPGANIVLAVSPSDDIGDIVATEAEILPRYPGAIVSQSFGADETDPTAQDDYQRMHDVFAAATALGGTILASSGDFGATAGGDTPVTAYPASDPLVTGVGGTEGKPYPGGLLKPHGGKYGDEQVWNESDTFGAATGGAPSAVFDAPSYQQGTGYSTRTVPDVAYNAAVDGGIVIYYGPYVFTFGGTSAGPPQWAGILALANEARAAVGQGPLGLANTALYALAQDRKSYKKDFHDITVGNNALGPSPGFAAGPGYDLATGLGTPDVDNLIRDLVRAASDKKPGDHKFHPGHKGAGGDHRFTPGD